MSWKLGSPRPAAIWHSKRRPWLHSGRFQPCFRARCPLGEHPPGRRPAWLQAAPCLTGIRAEGVSVQAGRLAFLLL